MPTVVKVKKNKTASIERFHPWVYSGALLDDNLKDIADGAPVEVLSVDGCSLGMGVYSRRASIAVRMLHFGGYRNPDLAFWKEKISAAYALRQATLPINEQTNCFRLIHGEGDGIPGLVVDIYGTVAVVQCHVLGIYKMIDVIADAIVASMPFITCVYDKSAATLHGSSETTDGSVIGTPQQSGIVLENGLQFEVDWAKGQKTGFFLDQRDNRQLLRQYVKNKTVLNAFSYTGGFSVYALAGGARVVHSVDISENAVHLCCANVALNGYEQSKHKGYVADVFNFLQSPPMTYDVLVVDPPAFAKNLSKRSQAIFGYRRLNRMVFELAQSGTLVFTFSCSQVIDDVLFRNTVVSAALDAGKRARILHYLHQPPDHPISLHHPEGSYLKGLVLLIE